MNGAKFSPGLFCEFLENYTDIVRGGGGGGPKYGRANRFTLHGVQIKCKKCGTYGGKTTFYNYEDGKLCKDCFFEMKQLQKDEEGK